MKLIRLSDGRRAYVAGDGLYLTEKPKSDRNAMLTAAALAAAAVCALMLLAALIRRLRCP